MDSHNDSCAFMYNVRDLFGRLVAQAIGMTAADLCASAKPWEVQAETVRVIFEEFYEQGDIEKKQGRKPIPMMDRDQAHQLPSSQVSLEDFDAIMVYTKGWEKMQY